MKSIWEIAPRTIAQPMIINNVLYGNTTQVFPYFFSYFKLNLTDEIYIITMKGGEILWIN